MKSLAHQFLDFCRSKPGDEGYDYVEPCGCAFAQFLIAAGYSDMPWVTNLGWYDRSGKHHDMVPEIEAAVIKLDSSLPNFGRTFSALASRLEQALTTPEVAGCGEVVA